MTVLVIHDGGSGGAAEGGGTTGGSIGVCWKGWMKVRGKVLMCTPFSQGYHSVCPMFGDTTISMLNSDIVVNFFFLQNGWLEVLLDSILKKKTPRGQQFRGSLAPALGAAQRMMSSGMAMLLVDFVTSNTSRHCAGRASPRAASTAMVCR